MSTAASLKFAIVGAGAWGTAFAVHLARNKQSVVLVPRRIEHAILLQTARQNADYLPGISLADSVQVESELDRAVEGASVILLACPSQALRATCQLLLKSLRGTAQPLILSLAKGLELGSLLRPSQVIAAELPSSVAGSLTGPTNASEVARGLPAAMVLAVQRGGALPHDVQAALSGPTLRVYTSDDLPGVEIGGSLKNVYAIAAGCSDGLKLGDNAKAALLTRALSEMVRVGTSLGARTETFFGLSGFGDLVATCYGEWSRNHGFGQEIGAGATVTELLENRKSVVEGYKTTEAFWQLCSDKQITAPILHETHSILFGGKAPAAALSSLMTRGLKCE
jgi:glycerol-3-phosphate dehydrogenase (NAD(P)+)